MDHRPGPPRDLRRVHEVIEMRVADQDVIALVYMLVDRVNIWSDPPEINVLLKRPCQERIDQQCLPAKSELKPRVPQPTDRDTHDVIIKGEKFLILRGRVR